MRSGYVDLNINQLWGIGYANYRWSHVIQSATSAYYLYTTLNRVVSSAGDVRWFGFPLCCSVTATILHLPLAFVRSGDVDISNGFSWGLGHAGYRWSRVSQSITIAYNTDMSPFGINTSNLYNRWSGFPLRFM